MSGSITADAVIGMSFGDEAKAKIVGTLLDKNKYTHCLRYCGSSNAGHTLYKDGKKIITHIVPAGALFGVESIVGPGCVLNENLFLSEIDELSKTIPDIASKVKISTAVHLVSQAHLNEELKEDKLGTTKKGVGPASRDKYARVGKRAESSAALKEFLIDMYDDFLNTEQEKVVICEGAQATFLDIDWGFYPYVTSTHCGIGGIVNNGIPIGSFRNIYGAAKCYDTYVGSKAFQDKNDPVLDKIADVGQEYGATTGRRRQVNYLNLDLIDKAKFLNSTTHIVFSKIDVLREIDVWKVIEDGRVKDLQDETSFVKHIEEKFSNLNIIFSDNPYSI